MTPLSSLNYQLPAKPVSKATSERAEWIGKFTDRLNADRGQYKPLTYKRVGVMLAHLSNQDLHAFWKQCEEARSFGAWFHYSLKPQKV